MVSDENIRVSIRVRPLNKRELTTSSNVAWRVHDSQTIVQHNVLKGIPPATYSFDHVFDEGVGNIHVYEAVAKNIITSTMEGFNGTIFAYGQTSSGKTHTIIGNEADPGVVPLAIEEVFNYMQRHPMREFLVRCSYLEIYNEVITDLLAPDKTNLKIREELGNGVYVEDLKEVIVTSAQQVLDLIKLGTGHRHIGATKMNEASSRSHCIFRMVIESREICREESVVADDYDEAIRVATLNLVDLAGSERAGSTGSEGLRLKEGGHINKSLLVLGNVISKLSESAATGGMKHVPYRDSKLTRILEPALGGNSRTAIICTATVAALHGEETHSTLKFASRAKKIKNQTVINECLDDAALLRRYKKEIAALQQKLTEQNQGENGVDAAVMQKVQQEREQFLQQLRDKETQRLEAEAKIANLSNFIITANSQRILPVKSKGPKSRAARHSWCPSELTVSVEGSADVEDNRFSFKPLGRSRKPESVGLGSLAEENDTQGSPKSVKRPSDCSDVDDEDATPIDLQEMRARRLSSVTDFVSFIAEPDVPNDRVETEIPSEVLHLCLMADQILEASVTAAHQHQLQCQEEIEKISIEKSILEQQTYELSMQHDQSLQQCSALENQLNQMSQDLAEKNEELLKEREIRSNLEQQIAEMPLPSSKSLEFRRASVYTKPGMTTDTTAMKKELGMKTIALNDMERSKEKSEKQINALMLELAALREKHALEMSELREELNAAKRESKSLGIKAVSAERSKEDALGIAEKAKEKIAALEQKIKSLSQEKVALTTEKANVERERKIAEQKSGIFEKEAKRIQVSAAKVKDKDKEISDLIAKVLGCTSTIADLECQISTKTAELSEKISKIESLEGELLQLQKEHEKQKEVWDETHRGLNGELQELKDVVENKENTIVTMKTAHATLNSTLETTMAERDKACNDLTDLMFSFNESKAELEAVQGEVAGYRDNLNASTEKLQQIQQQMTTLENDKQKQCANILQLNQYNEKLLSELQLLTRCNTDLESRLACNQNQLAQLLDAAHLAEDKVACLGTLLTQQHSVVLRVVSERDQCLVDIHALQQQNDGLRQLEAEYIAAATASLNEADDRARIYLDRLTACEREKEECETKLQEAVAEKKDLESKTQSAFQSMQSRADVLEEAVQFQKTQNAKLKNENAELREALHCQLAEYPAVHSVQNTMALETAQSECKKLQNQLELEIKKCGSLQDEVKTLKQALINRGEEYERAIQTVTASAMQKIKKQKEMNLLLAEKLFVPKEEGTPTKSTDAKEKRMPLKERN